MADVRALGDELYRALRARVVVPPLTGRVPRLDVAMAYAIAAASLDLRRADGERVVGYKIGVTSPAVQAMLGVAEPDYGTLTDTMQAEGEIDASTQLIQPRIEGEIALCLGDDLPGGGVTPSRVLAATASVHPCFEIVDSRIAAWRIRIEDTIADNASSARFVVGEGVSPVGLDLEGCEMEVHKNGVFLSRGFGRAALGSPLRAAAWLADTLGRAGVPLRAGAWILTGSLVPLEPVAAGDRLALTITGIGGVEVRFR